MRAPRGQAGGAVQAALTAISTALVCVATMVFTVYVPATKGFFNLGETMVYTVAILFGPYVGAVAGGLGSALADVLLGYPYYAPGTLVIKASEGFVVGWLTRRMARLGQRAWTYLTSLLAFLSGSLLASIGACYYSGAADITLLSAALTLQVPPALWICLGVGLAVLIMALGLSSGPEAGWRVLAVLAGGCVMVLGYFLYEFFVPWLGPLGWAALAEVPVNVGQVAVGLTVAIPLTRALEKRLRPLEATARPLSS